MLGSVLLLLLIARVVAPFVLENRINARLARIPNYEGHVGDIDLSLWRGAYTLRDVMVRRRGGEDDAPLLDARRIDFSISWANAWRGRMLSDISIEQAQITVVRRESTAPASGEEARTWQEVVQDIFPIDITHLEIIGGDIHYVDKSKSPEIDVSVHDIRLTAQGLRNRQDPADQNQLPATINLEGTTVGHGAVSLGLRLAPLTPQPLFDLELTVTQLSLPALNSLLRAYANVDVSQGTFELYLEVAARDGAFQGYVKPFFRDLNFRNYTDRKRPILSRLWESAVNFMNNVLTNPERHRLGTRVPFSGSFEGTEVGTWTGIVNTLRYGFGAAFSESVEGTLDPGDVAPPEEK